MRLMNLVEVEQGLTRHFCPIKYLCRKYLYQLPLTPLFIGMADGTRSTSGSSRSLTVLSSGPLTGALTILSQGLGINEGINAFDLR